MNSNGDANHNNFNVDNQRGGGQPGRYRGNGRRSRGRGSNQDRAPSRGGRDKRSNLRDAHPQRSTINEFIDLNDSSQFPSIMESSSGTAVRQRSQQASQTNQSTTTPPVTVNAVESHSQRSSLSSRGAPYRGGSYSQGGQNPQGSGSMYQPRDYPSRYGSNRIRGPRYGNPARAYSNSYNRRYVRAPFQNVPNPYPADPMMSGYFNGHFVVSSNYQSQAQYASEAPRPREIDPMKQVEYYFSVPNLEHDIYLRSHMDQDGWVDIDVIHRFKRIQALELSFEDFLSRILASEVLEIDSEKKKVRTKIDPQRWVLSSEKHLFQLGGEVDQSQGMAASSDPYNSPVYSMQNPNQVYSNFPPFFLPFPSYPNNAPQGHGRGRYPQYQMYPTSYLGMPYSPDMPTEGGFNYYSHGEYSGSYQTDSSQGYSNPADAKEDVTEVAETFPISTDSTQVEGSTEKRSVQNQEIDEVTSKISKIDVNSKTEDQ